MDNQRSNVQSSSGTSTIGQIIWRFVAAAVVLAITAFFTPGFTINNIWSSPFGKGFVGFVLSAVVLYVTQFFVAGYAISWIAAIIGALVYGVVDYFIPGDNKL